MLILFGSYARGDWVVDRYVEDNIIYTYESDFDLLVVSEDRGTRHDGRRVSALRCDRAAAASART